MATEDPGFDRNHDFGDRTRLHRIPGVDHEVEQHLLAPIDTAGDPERERSLLATYVRERDLTWTIALADDPAAFDAFAVSRLPARVIIDAAGTVRHVGLSPTEPLAGQSQRLDALLAEQGSASAR